MLVKLQMKIGCMLMLFSLTIDASSRSDRVNKAVASAVNASNLRYRVGNTVSLLVKGVEPGFTAKLSDGENRALVTSPKRNTVHVDNASFDRLTQEKEIDFVSEVEIMGHSDVTGYVIVCYKDGSSKLQSKQAYLKTEKLLSISKSNSLVI